MAKILFLFLCIYIIQLFFIHFIPFSVPREVNYMGNYLSQKRDILYFGDSVLDTTSWGDRDKRTLPQMLQGLLPHNSVAMLAHPADQPDVFLEYCRYLSRSAYKPKVVIVPISMRIFSIEWELNPGKQFEEEKLYFRYAHTPVYPFLPFLISFHVFPLYPRTQDAFMVTSFIYNNKNLGTVGDYFGDKYNTYSKENMQKKITLYYSYNLSQNDAKLSSLKQIVDTCGRDRVLFYITPIAFDTGEEFLGKAFTKQTEKNIVFLKNTIQEKGITILDLSHVLTSDNFFWEDELYMNEHLNQRGRAKVAAKVAEAVKIKLHSF